MEQSEKRGQSLLQEKLLETRSIVISGEVSQELAESVLRQLLVLEAAGDAPIQVFLNSQGGHVEAGDTIHDMLRFVRPEIIMIGTGWVASAGITIYLAAERENRLSLPNTRYMIHQPSGGVRGPATDIGIAAEQIVEIRTRINRLIAERTGTPLEQVERDTQRDYWMDPVAAKEYGIVGDVIVNRDALK